MASLLTLCLNWNIQSLPAKWTFFTEFLSELSNRNFSFDVIALQELWQLNEPELYSLPGYQKFIYRTRANNVQGGGCGIFVKEGYKVNVLNDLSVFTDRVIETQFIEVETRPGHWITVASVYRPNTHQILTATEQIDQFLDTFENLLQSLANQN